jgi:replicative DNA helicase
MNTDTTVLREIKGRLSEYLELKGIDSTKNFQCLSGTHPDMKPSMSYNKGKEQVHCFSCGFNADVIDLIGKDYNLDYKEAVKRACELFAVTTKSAAAVTPKKPIKENADAAAVDYTSFYRQAAANITKTDYPQRRGLSDAVIRRFNLGFVPDWRHPKVTEFVSTSPRLIIPTSNNSYLARLTREITTPIEEKYKKLKVGSVNLFNAEALYSSSKPVFIVEGEIDALSIITAAGDAADAVALGSIANSKYLLEYIADGGEKIKKRSLILALDNDDAGKNAAEELEKELRKQGFLLYRLDYGSYKDANEFLVADRERFFSSINAAILELAECEEQERKEYITKNSAATDLKDFLSVIGSPADTPYTPTGFKRLDSELFGGFREGLYILGAISTLGKTSLILQIANQIAAAGSSDVLFFSLEMSKRELTAKSISRHTVEIALNNKILIDNAKTTLGITTGEYYKSYSETEKQLIGDAVVAYGKYAERLFFYEGLGDIGAHEIRKAIEAHVSITGKTPIVIIDYLQILAPYNERATEKQNVDTSVLELKRISRDFKIPVIGISSFNRANYKKPVAMAAFKESGAIEYSSDVLFGLQFEEAGKGDFDITAAMKEDPRKIELVILKNRNGKVGGKISFNFYAMFNYFKEAPILS